MPEDLQRIRLIIDVDPNLELNRLGWLRGFQKINNRDVFGDIEWTRRSWQVGIFKPENRQDDLLFACISREEFVLNDFPAFSIGKQSDPLDARLWLSGINLKSALAFVRCLTPMIKSVSDTYSGAMQMLEHDEEKFPAVSLRLEGPNGESFSIMATMSEYYGARLQLAISQREEVIHARYLAKLHGITELMSQQQIELRRI